MFDLKEYQIKAVYKLSEYINEALLLDDPSQVIVFEAPTGSGKTIIAADLINQLSQYDEHDLSFVWLAPNKLEQQSKDKLQKYLDSNKNITISEWDQLQNNKIDINEIYIANWQSLNSDKNIARIKNETNFYLDTVIENTKQNSKIITIIDESHRNIGTEKSNEVLRIINPDVILNISATQKSSLKEQSNFQHKIQIKSVKQEEMIKNHLIINDNNINIKDTGEITSEYSDIDEEDIISKGLEKLNYLEGLYKKEKSNIQPLLLVQLPRKLSSDEEQPFVDKLEKYLLKKDISYENKKLARYLDRDKINLDKDNQPLSSVSVLFFKEAIAVGWDCPRSQILVSFRDIKSITFSLQTIGRIMRVPEPNRGWYSLDELNNAYIYTNQENFKAKAELMTGNFLFFKTSHRKEIYKNLNLTSYFRPRNNPKYRLESEFVDLFVETANEMNLINEIDLKPKKIFRKRIQNEIITDIDTFEEIKASTNKEVKTYKNLFYEFEKKIKLDLVSPFNPQETNFRQIKNSIRAFFEIENSLPKLIKTSEEQEIEWLKIFLNEKNYSLFKNVLEKSKHKYQKQFVQSSMPVEIVNMWEIPKTINYEKNVVEQKFSKNIMEPYFTSTSWESEKNFERFIDNLDSVEWWHKNGESDKTHFAVKYVEGKKDKLFYVDYIIKFKKSKKIGLFDTKQGDKKILESEQKNIGLQTYLKSSSNLIGGLVSNTNDNYSGNWKCLLSNKIDTDLNSNNWTLFSVIE